MYTTTYLKNIANKRSSRLLTLSSIFFCFFSILITNGGYSQIWSQRDIFQSFVYTNAPVNAGEELVLAAFGGTSWQWNGPNNFYSNDNYIIIPNTTSSMQGTYYVTITDTLYDTVVYLSTSVNIISLLNPCIITFKNLACINSYFQLNTSFVGPNYQYLWSCSPGTNYGFFPNNNVANPQIVFGDIGNYTVTLHIIDVVMDTSYSCSCLIHARDCCSDGNVTLINNTTLAGFLSTGQPFL
ncbi:MAG: hypothetical protein NTV87_15040 [Ignavibacteriae bacterium]|nr:hypothetical protein [Ignavibacteriota bacterium]